MKEETARRTKYAKEEKKMYKARMRRFKKENKPRGSGFITFLAALTAWGLVDTMFKVAKVAKNIGKGNQNHGF